MSNHLSSSFVGTVFLGLALALVGCTAPTEASDGPVGTTDDALSFRELPLITSRTTVPSPDETTCKSMHVPVPAALLPYGCTMGVQYSNPPPGISGGYVWACPTTTTVVPEGGGRTVKGMPNPPGVAVITDIFATTSQDVASTCWGNPQPGSELVFELYELEIGNGSEGRKPDQYESAIR